ncbi:MAG: hypothetical protein AAGA03_15140, partial [Planctomycetota bacterium]
MPTISIDLDRNEGDTGLTAWLYDAGTLVNTGGDSLTEVGNGRFTFDVSETLTATTSYRVVIRDSGSNKIFADDLRPGQTHVGLRGIATESRQQSLSIEIDAAVAAIQGPDNDTLKTIADSLVVIGGYVDELETRLPADTSTRITDIKAKTDQLLFDSFSNVQALSNRMS